jgi:sugar phosphate isomerase/epimerase
MKKWKYAVSYAKEAPVTAPLPLCGDLYAALEKAGSYGYQAIEVHTRENTAFNYEKIEEVSTKVGAGICMIVTGRLFTEGKCSLLDDAVYAVNAAMEGMKNYIEMAARLKTGIVIGWAKGVVPPNADRTKYLARLGDLLKQLNDYALQREVRINVEVINHYETNVFNTAKETLDFIKEYSLDNTYVHLDTYHMALEESNPYSAIQLCGDRLGYFHVSDSTRRYPGSGQFDFARILRTLGEIDYSGYVTVECLPDPDRDTAAKEAVKHLRDCEP